MSSVRGDDGEGVKLRCKRRYRKAAESLSLALRLRLTDKNLESLFSDPTGL